MENWKRVHICTFAFFQFPTLPIFHIYNLYFSNFPLVHFCIPILTPIYPNIPIQSSIYHKHSPQDSIRVLHTFEGGVSKHPVLPTGHYLMYKTYSAMVYRILSKIYNIYLWLIPLCLRHTNYNNSGFLYSW